MPRCHGQRNEDKGPARRCLGRSAIAPRTHAMVQAPHGDDAQPSASLYVLPAPTLGAAPHAAPLELVLRGGTLRFPMWSNAQRRSGGSRAVWRQPAGREGVGAALKEPRGAQHGRRNLHAPPALAGALPLSAAWRLLLHRPRRRSRLFSTRMHGESAHHSTVACKRGWTSAQQAWRDRRAQRRTCHTTPWQRREHVCELL
jgi:hypothetical protein